jgi:NAD(P)-dependent dehydrogenase (short-subunit alcohol dehydrogenase family)
MDQRNTAHTGTFDWGLEGRKILITGASSGIGRDAAMFFAQVGAGVALAARRLDKLEEVALEIERLGGTAIAVEMDVCDETSMRRAADEVEDRLGVIDVLINNAGIAPFENAFDQDVETWDLVHATNLRGPWYLSSEFARRMRDSSRPGAIVNVASIAGLRQSPFMGAYCTSKAALVQLTACMALEFAPFGIRVNAIAPGIVESELTAGFADSPAGKAMLKRVPMGRFGTTEDLRFALMWLASGYSSFVTGSCIVIDGGSMVSSL